MLKHWFFNCGYEKEHLIVGDRSREFEILGARQHEKKCWQGGMRGYQNKSGAAGAAD